ncbi:hypothetical protein ABK040_007943 [Willaertia magna]
MPCNRNSFSELSSSTSSNSLENAVSTFTVNPDYNNNTNISSTTMIVDNSFHHPIPTTMAITEEPCTPSILCSFSFEKLSLQEQQKKPNENLDAKQAFENEFLMKSSKYKHINSITRESSLTPCMKISKAPNNEMSVSSSSLATNATNTAVTAASTIQNLPSEANQIVNAVLKNCIQKKTELKNKIRKNSKPINRKIDLKINTKILDTNVASNNTAATVDNMLLVNDENVENSNHNNNASCCISRLSILISNSSHSSKTSSSSCTVVQRK